MCWGADSGPIPALTSLSARIKSALRFNEAPGGLYVVSQAAREVPATGHASPASPAIPIPRSAGGTPPEQRGGPRPAHVTLSFSTLLLQINNHNKAQKSPIFTQEKSTKFPPKFFSNFFSVF